MHRHLTDVFARLDETRASLGAAVGSVPASLRERRPAPDSWSVAEVLEHLSIVERAFAGRVASAIDAARTSGLGAETGGREPLPEVIETRMADRVNTRNAPDTAKPSGTLDTTAAWAAVEAGHQRLRTIVEAADGFALSQVTSAHPVFGVLTVYQLIELISAHEARHTEQVKAIGSMLSSR